MPDPRTLSHLPTPDLIAGALAEAREDPDSDERWDHVAALHLQGTTEAFEAAAGLCRGGSVLERALGADILGQLGAGQENPRPFREESVPLLLELLDDADETVIANAASALGHLDERTHIERLLELASHDDDGVRYAVVQALLGNEDPRAVSALIGLSRDPDPEIRDWATFGLGSQIALDTPEIREALLARTTDEHDDARGEALAGLALRHDSRVLAPLREELLGDMVGVLAVQAAREMGSPELHEPLQELAEWWDIDAPLLAEAMRSCSPEPA